MKNKLLALMIVGSLAACGGGNGGGNAGKPVVIDLNNPKNNPARNDTTQYPAFNVYEGVFTRIHNPGYEDAANPAMGEWIFHPTHGSQIEKDMKQFNVQKITWWLTDKSLQVQADCAGVVGDAQNNVHASLEGNVFTIKESMDERLLDKDGNLQNCYIATSVKKYNAVVSASGNELRLTVAK